MSARIWALLLGLQAASAVGADDVLHAKQNGFSLRSENVLSSIHLFEDSIAEVVANLGPPTRVVVAKSAAQSVTLTTRNYEWNGKTSLLRVITSESPGFKERLDRVDVWGSHPDGIIGTTGRGLDLGDPISKARAIYGLQLFFGVTMSEKSGLHWDSYGCNYAYVADGRLQVEFDRDGRINHMGTTTPPMICW